MLFLLISLRKVTTANKNMLTSCNQYSPTLPCTWNILRLVRGFLVKSKMDYSEFSNLPRFNQHAQFHIR